MLAKAFSVIVAGVFTVIALKRAFTMFKALEKSKVRADAPPERPMVGRLRQDPVTGIYYPEG